MQILDKNRNYNTRTPYTARRVASADVVVNGVKDSIDIYKLTDKDHKYVKRIMDGIDLKKLYPEEKPSKLTKWQVLIGDASMYVGELENEHSFLAVKNHKPCGIIVGTNSENGFVEVLSKMPSKIGENIRGIGRAILTSFMEVINKTNSAEIELEPMRGGPVDCVKFYKSQRFKFKDSAQTQMTISKPDIAKTIEENKKAANYRSIEEEEKDIKEIIY